MKKAANSFCDILSFSGDLCKAQGVLSTDLKHKQSRKASKSLHLLGGVGAEEQAHAKAELSWVAFRSCFISVTAGVGWEPGSGRWPSGFPQQPRGCSVCPIARLGQQWRSRVFAACPGSAVSHLRSG